VSLKIGRQREGRGTKCGSVKRWARKEEKPERSTTSQLDRTGDGIKGTRETKLLPAGHTIFSEVVIERNREVDITEDRLIRGRKKKGGLVSGEKGEGLPKRERKK